MKKPLWIFFNYLKDRSPLILSLDQYHYFFMAWQQLPTDCIANHIELRDYCKIFWLKNQEHERVFDSLFEMFIDDEEIRALFPAIKEALPSPTLADQDKDLKPESEDDLTKNHQKIEDDTSKNNNDDSTDKFKSRKRDRTKNNFVDFNLVISDKESQLQKKTNETYQFKHHFILNDQDIMPFKLRHFAQRLRRKVETPVRELSDELDFDRIIQQYCEHRHINEIIYKHRDSSISNVILMADRYGSMLAYEYLENHLRDAIKAIPDCKHEHYYFKNLPVLIEDTEYYEMKSVNSKVHTTNTSKVKWDANSWIFIFSDAGAHSGMLNKDRMRATIRMWKRLKEITRHVYWINPVSPKFIGPGTAQRLQIIIPMIFPVQDELNNFFNTI